MQAHPIAELLEICEAAARAGGRELIAWRGRFKTREKGAADYVTDADLASQAAIREVIAARFSDHDFIGEEQPPESFPNRGDQMNWIVDPLDGTTNYVHDLPFYAVSVAVARGSELLAGVIYDPIADKCFASAAGQGAWCDGARLKSSAAKQVGEALVAVSLPARVHADAPDLLDFIAATQVCQGVRRTGSAALNLANVASGALDAFWATHIHPWDVAAGVLLVREAGGVVTGRDGREFNLWKPHFIAAASRELHGDLLKSLTPFHRG
jgi:myo-inositol-1(or 4)-monophosphatase